jgi:hypothetical protein
MMSLNIIELDDIGYEIMTIASPATLLTLGKTCKSYQNTVCRFRSNLKKKLDEKYELNDLPNAESIISELIENDNYLAIGLLMKAIDPLIYQRYYSYSVFGQAAYHGNKVLDLLISNGQDLNITDRGFTVLMELSQFNLIIGAMKLIKAGAQLDIQSTKSRPGYTALMFAAQKDYSEMVCMLINANADITLRDKYGHTALQVAGHWDALISLNILIKTEEEIDFDSGLGPLRERFIR